MSRASSLKRLTDKLFRLEEEVRSIRGDLEAELRRQDRGSTASRKSASSPPALPLVEKSVLGRWASEISRALSLPDLPAGALELQARSRGCGLEPDELSRALVQAREE